VKVDSLRGNVQLSGFVDNQAQKDRAGQIAASAKDVVSVHNDLIVGAQPGTMPTGR
jgi:hyperosmotically inducible protein